VKLQHDTCVVILPFTYELYAPTLAFVLQPVAVGDIFTEVQVPLQGTPHRETVSQIHIDPGIQTLLAVFLVLIIHTIRVGPASGSLN